MWHSKFADCHEHGNATSFCLQKREFLEGCAVHNTSSPPPQKKLNYLEIRKQYLVEIRNTFAALETLNEDEDVNRIWGKH